MADQAVLLALSSLCGSSVRYVDLVLLTYMERQKKLYLAVGAQALFLVRRDWTRVLTGGEILYGMIKQVVDDEASEMDIVLLLDADELSRKQNKVWNAAEPLTITTINKALLLQWLEVAWSADFMLRKGRLGVFPKYLGKMSDEEQKNQFPAVQYDSYSFFLHREFEDRSGGAETLQTGTYLDGRGVEVSVSFEPPINVQCLEQLGRDNIRHVAVSWKKALLESDFQTQLLRSQPYIKKMNLCDDPASWSGWQLWVRTETHTIVCIILRRSYFPPMMDLSQDMTILFRISYEDQKAYNVRDLDFLKEAEFAADSLAPIAQTHSWLREILQAKLDALIYQPEQYQWFALHLKMHPKWIAHARMFLKSILALLYKEGVLADAELLDLVGEHVEVVEDPMTVAHELIRQGEGLDPVIDSKISGAILAVRNARKEASGPRKAGAPEDTVSEVGDREMNEDEEEAALLDSDLEPQEIIAYHRWSMRVSQYLAYCIDEGVLGYKFCLADLSEAIGLVSQAADRKLREIFAFILHLRPKNMILRWSAESLRHAKTTLKKRDYIFNDRVFVPLVECGFMAKLFSKGEEAAYLDLLRVLLLGATSLGLKTALCRQILKASGDRREKQSSEALYTVVPALVNVLRNKANISARSTVPLLNLALSALVNLSAGDARVKEILLETDVYHAIVFVLKTKEDSLMLPCVQLSVNLTKTGAHRQAFISSGAFNLLLDLLMAQYSSLYFHKQKLLACVAGLLGQLANEPKVSQDMVDNYPVLDCLLYMFHAADTTIEFRSKVVFGLKQLSQGRWHVQQRVGKHCIQTLVTELRESGSYVDYSATVLVLLQVLSDFKPNCFDMKAAGIHDAFEYLLARTKVDSIYTRIAGLQERINRQTRYDYFAS
ncbi:conserved hypothetical protein [Neospora caninum Liverpool]|uniref:ARM repeat protein n=1 Tax=Neospora caninum (strain Liverpool) TaxID=572307 RepID=F0VR13_NEOCL|nr:conserved hypothetical protein [Neospora caninum Liverpool]CBZ56160.1 conserved hypothetical protein [Neospora caninum Liverpool]CEL70917.1 TPA: hypothetical protein BN1204_065860 [Neospora caninum Liverpool]|eukprot:XP_003886186.1 conserved hypothetical protein [Neospora caninum Liverpool]